MPELGKNIEDLKRRVEEAKQGLRATMTVQELGRDTVRDIVKEVAETNAIVSKMFDKEDSALSASTQLLKTELQKLVDEGGDADQKRLREISARAKDIAKIASEAGGVEGEYLTELAQNISGASARAGRVNVGVGTQDMFGMGLFTSIFGSKFSNFIFKEGGPPKGRSAADLRHQMAVAEYDAATGVKGTANDPSEIAEEEREQEVRQGEIEIKEDRVISLLEEILKRVSVGGGGGGVSPTMGGRGAPDEGGMDAKDAAVMGAWIFGPTIAQAMWGKKGIQAAGATIPKGAKVPFWSLGMGVAGWTTLGIGAVIWAVGEAMIHDYQKQASDIEMANRFFMGRRRTVAGDIIDNATDTVIFDAGKFARGETDYEGQTKTDVIARGELRANEAALVEYAKWADQERMKGDDGAVNGILSGISKTLDERADLVSRIRGPNGEYPSGEELQKLIKLSPDGDRTLSKTLRDISLGLKKRMWGHLGFNFWDKDIIETLIIKYDAMKGNIQAKQYKFGGNKPMPDDQLPWYASSDYITEDSKAANVAGIQAQDQFQHRMRGDNVTASGVWVGSRSSTERLAPGSSKFKRATLEEINRRRTLRTGIQTRGRDVIDIPEIPLDQFGQPVRGPGKTGTSEVLKEQPVWVQPEYQAPHPTNFNPTPQSSLPRNLDPAQSLEMNSELAFDWNGGAGTVSASGNQGMMVSNLAMSNNNSTVVGSDIDDSMAMFNSQRLDLFRYANTSLDA